MKRLGSNEGAISFLASFASIVIGLLFGFILLLILDADNAVAGMGNMLSNGFKNIGNVLYSATPLIMVGLSVAFAFKVGLFNIGASGQYTIGALLALLCGIVYGMPWYVCLLVAVLGGAFWGLFPGLFKAIFNVNEVITCIMLNWIGMNLTNLVVYNTPKFRPVDWGVAGSDRTAALKDANPDAILPKLGLDKLFNYSALNIGIIIAIILAIVVWVVMNKTTFGYELRACGLNRNGAIYAGINAKKNIILSTVIAGALAGLGGGLYYLAGSAQYVAEQSILTAGFNGIPVALLANSNPLGVILSGIFISFLNLGGFAMQSQGYAVQATDLVIAAIIYLAAFSLLFKIKLVAIFNNFKKGGASK